MMKISEDVKRKVRSWNQRHKFKVSISDPPQRNYMSGSVISETFVGRVYTVYFPETRTAIIQLRAWLEAGRDVTLHIEPPVIHDGLFWMEPDTVNEETEE